MQTAAVAPGGSDATDHFSSEDLLADRHEGVDRLIGRAKAAVVNTHDPPASQISGVDDPARAGCEDPRSCGGSQIYSAVTCIPIGGTGGERSRDPTGAIEGRAPSGCFGWGRHQEGEESDYGHDDESGAAHPGRLPGYGSRSKVPEPPCGRSTPPRPVHFISDQKALAGRLHRTTFAGSGPPDTFQRSRVPAGGRCGGRQEALPNRGEFINLRMEYAMAVVTMRQLLESGVHFGHQTRRWNPKMKRFIITERNGIYIIDLQQSLSYIDRAYEFVKETVAHGGSIMFVGTKKQAQEPVAQQAARVGMPYVNQRWLGGMLTNFNTVYKRLQRMKELEQIDFTNVAASGLTKKELLVLEREKDKLTRTLGGLRDMHKVPSIVWVVDTKKEHIAVGEARKLGIPVIAILDTNCDPDEVDFPIPGNDDAIRSVALLTRVIADAVAEGLMARASRATGAVAVAEVIEPLAEWEQELLAGAGEVVAPVEDAAPAAE